MQRRLLTILGAITVATTAACSTDVTPRPAPPTSTPTATPLPTRPRDIPIDDVDPCSLLTAEQRAALTLDTEPGRSTPTTRLLGTTHDCTILGFGTPNIAVALSLAPDAGIERFTGGELRADITPIDIDGFPGVLFVTDGFTDFCGLVIDISPGEVIALQFRDGGAQEPIPLPTLCAGARRTATEIIRTLLAL